MNNIPIVKIALRMVLIVVAVALLAYITAALTWLVVYHLSGSSRVHLNSDYYGSPSAQLQAETFDEDDLVILSKQRSEKICRALSEFYDQNGFYPAKLQDLSPMYIAAVPYSHAGNPNWYYSIYVDGSGNENAEIGFGVGWDFYPSLYLLVPHCTDWKADN